MGQEGRHFIGSWPVGPGLPHGGGYEYLTLSHCTGISEEWIPHKKHRERQELCSVAEGRRGQTRGSCGGGGGGGGNGSASAREEDRRGERGSPVGTPLLQHCGDICGHKRPTAQLAVPLGSPLLGKSRERMKIWLLILNIVLLLLRK